MCSFTVAVNRRRQQEGQPEADFFRVSAWRQLGENCARYLTKGRKVCVIGPVAVSTYTGQDGTTRASMDVTADDVEFLTPKSEAGETDLYQAQKARKAQQNEQEAEDRYTRAEREAIQTEGSKNYVQVDDGELPF